MSSISPGGTIGIIGGGQLGRMTASAARELGYKTHIYCPEQDCPASQIAEEFTCASYDDKESLRQFAKSVDVISFEFENIPTETVEFLGEIVFVRPSSKSLYIAQNRIREKDFFKEVGTPTNRYMKVSSAEDIEEGIKQLGVSKAILKTTEFGYDGKGQAVIKDGDDYTKLWSDNGFKEAILEEFIAFTKEISVIIARGVDGEMAVFPVSENVHKNGILDTTTVPADIEEKTEKEAKNVAKKIVDGLGLVGLLAVEFFVTKDGSVLVNEIAPRPHNSGHWTMDGCSTSQFEQFVRAICGLPLGVIEQHSAVQMKNLIGDYIDQTEEIQKDPAARLHMYGKKEVREGRKMGHVNYVSPLSYPK